MTMDVNGATSTNRITMASLGPTGSLQIIFAKLQLELAQSAKSQAMDRMDSIKATQDEQKQVAAMLNQARQLQSDAKGGTGNAPGDSHASMMPVEMQEYMDKNELAYDRYGEDRRHNEKEWEVAIKSLEDHLEMLGTDTQQQMVYVQDYMGQYNSYLQGANTQISESNRTLGTLAKGQ